MAVLQKVVDEGLAGRVCEFLSAAKGLRDSGGYVSKNAVEILLSLGDPKDQKAFDREAPHQVLMGTYVQDAMGTSKRVCAVARAVRGLL